MSIQFAKNFSYYTIGNILPKIFSFFLLPLYTRYLTPADYGIVNSMEVLSGVLVIFFSLSVERSVYRLYYDYNTDKEKKDYLGTVIISILIISTIILLILFIFYHQVGMIFKSISFYPFFFYAIVTSYISIYSLIPKIYYQIIENAGKFITLSIFQFICNIIFVVWFVIFMKQGAVGMMKGGLYASLFTLPFFIIISYKIINFRFDISILRESLKFSIPMFPVIISAWVLSLSDRIFIERYFSTNEVGIYSLGYKLAGMVMIFVSSMETAVNPVFYRLANDEDQITAKQKLSKLNNYYILALLIICFTISFFAKDILYIFIDSKFKDAYKIIPLISLAYFIYIASGIYNRMIYQEKKTSMVMYATVLSAIVSVGLNFCLIPYFGIYGASFSAIFAYTVALIIKKYYARKCYYIKTNPLNFLGLLIGIIIVAITFVFNDINIWIMFSAKILFVITVLAIIIKLNYRRILEIIKKQ